MTRGRSSATRELSGTAGRTVVLSPHLDDAVFSIGAAIASATRRGGDVRVLTVFAGDPDSELPAGSWDGRAGFKTAGEAARLRREEDDRACRLLGAQAEWLPLHDSQYRSAGDEDEIWRAVSAAVEGTQAVLLPGFPLEHTDHELLARLVRERGLPVPRLGLYVEQPYGMWAERKPNGAGWRSLRAGPVQRLRKTLACKAYRSQLPLLGPRMTLKLNRHEMLHGERVVWPEGT